MATPTVRNNLEGRPDGHDHDLKLLCAKDEFVLVSSQLLEDSSRSPAIKDIIAKLRQEHPGASDDAPMALSVPRDSADVWEVVWRLVKSPMDVKHEGLTWDWLCDKWQLVPGFYACDTFIVNNMPKEPQVTECPAASNFPWAPGDPGYDAWLAEAPFGSWIVEWWQWTQHGITLGYYPVDFDLDLEFLELLHRAEMHRSVACFLPLYTSLLRDALKEGKGVGRLVRDMQGVLGQCGSRPVQWLVSEQVFRVLAAALP